MQLIVFTVCLITLNLTNCMIFTVPLMTYCSTNHVIQLRAALYLPLLNQRLRRGRGGVRGGTRGGVRLEKPTICIKRLGHIFSADLCGDRVKMTNTHKHFLLR